MHAIDEPAGSSGHGDDNEFYRRLRREAPPAPAGASMREEALAVNRARRLARAVESAGAATGLRPAAAHDLAAAAEILARRPFANPEALLAARSHDREALADELGRLGFPAGFLVRVGADGRPAALVGVAPAPGSAREAWLLGPADAEGDEAAEETLLDRALAIARAEGAGRLVAHTPAREPARAALLERHGFLRLERLEAFEARRSAKVRLFMNPRDRIVVLEPGDPPGPAAALFARAFPGADRGAADIARAIADPAVRIFLLERDGAPAGFLELDLSRRGRALVTRAGAAPILDADGVVRTLLAAAARTAFRASGVGRLEAHLAERVAAADGDLAPIGFRPAEKYARHGHAVEEPPRP